VQAADPDIEYCNHDEECTHIHEYYVCIPDVHLEDLTLYKGTCGHKPLFPLHPREIVGTFVFALMMMLSKIAGIGGGGIAVPLVGIFFDFSLKPAIAISSFSIFICSLTWFATNWKMKHPEKPNVIVVDYGLTNVMMPLNLLGSLIGAYIYLVFPDVILTVLLTLLLAFLAYKSTLQFYKIRSEENLMAR
jgi:uncharacterized membrane protein YfcA